MILRRIGRLILIIIAPTGVYFALTLVLRPWYNRWGATDTEVGKSLPGDDLVPEPKSQVTRAATITAPATFHFDEQGRFVWLTAIRNNDARGRPEPWSIPVRAYGEFQGVRISTEGDGVWNYETGDFTYIHWRITEIEYDRPSEYQSHANQAGCKCGGW